MHDIIYNILVPVYKDYGLCEWITNRICKAWSEGDAQTTGDVKMIIWWATSGGSTAELMAERIQTALPGCFRDSLDRTPDRRYRDEVKEARGVPESS